MPPTKSDVRWAMESVDRGDFLPEQYRSLALADTAIPFADGITVPPRSITAMVVELLDLHPDDKVLEIGTGSGYQTAVLARCCCDVTTCDISQVPLSVAQKLPEHVTIYSGRDGRWPFLNDIFDAVLVTAGAHKIFDFWPDVLAEGGRLVLPLGEDHKYELRKFVKEGQYLRDRGTFAYLDVVPLRRE